MFCSKMVKKFARHVIYVDKTEDEVKQVLSLEKKSLEKKQITDKLIIKGNYIYNHHEYTDAQIFARREINKKTPSY